MSRDRGHVEIVRTNAGHHIRIVAANGETLASSETLSREIDARANVAAIARAIDDWVDYGERRVDERGDGS